MTTLRALWESWVGNRFCLQAPMRTNPRLSSLLASCISPVFPFQNGDFIGEKPCACSTTGVHRTRLQTTVTACHSIPTQQTDEDNNRATGYTMSETATNPKTLNGNKIPKQLFDRHTESNTTDLLLLSQVLASSNYEHSERITNTQKIDM